MAVMSEGLGFNLCVVPFLNICVSNLPQGQGWSMSEVVGVGQRCCTRDRQRGTKVGGQVGTKANVDQ